MQVQRHRLDVGTVALSRRPGHSCGTYRPDGQQSVAGDARHPQDVIRAFPIPQHGRDAQAPTITGRLVVWWRWHGSSGYTREDIDGTNLATSRAFADATGATGDAGAVEQAHGQAFARQIISAGCSHDPRADHHDIGAQGRRAHRRQHHRHYPYKMRTAAPCQPFMSSSLSLSLIVSSGPGLTV